MGIKKNKLDTLHIALFAVIFAVIGLAWLGISSAERQTNNTGVTGTVTIDGSNENLSYGDSVKFIVTTTGKVSTQGYFYVQTLCFQNEKVVYQWSKQLNDLVFTLIDQEGQNLDWNGGAATCSANLIYRVEKGKNTEITQLNSVSFNVAAR